MPPFLPRKHLRSVSPEAEAVATKSPSRDKAKGKTATLTPPRKQTLFEALDADASSRASAKDPKKLLAKLAGSDDDSSELSSLPESEPEDEFEDVPNLTRRKIDHSDGDDEDIEFEDVHTHVAPTVAPPPSGDLDLTLTKETRISVVNPHGKKQGPSKIERGIRVSTHQMHVMFLMWHNAVRNSWIADKEVHRILVEQLGPGLKEEVEKWRASIGLNPLNESKLIGLSKDKKAKGKGKKQNARSQRDWGQPAEKQAIGPNDKSHQQRFYKLLRYLASYWKKRFTVTEPGLKKMGYMSLPRIDEEIKSFHNDEHDPELHGERIASLDEFRKRAKVCEGSRDLGAQLFTALLRSVGIEARMVVSLQPVGFGWSKNEEAAERKKKTIVTGVVDADDDTSAEETEDSIEAIQAQSTMGNAGRHTGADPKKASKSVPKTSKGRSSRGSGKKGEPINLSESDSDAQPAAVSDTDGDDSVVDVTPLRPRSGISKSYEKDLSPNYWSEFLSPYTNTYVPCSTLLQEVFVTNPKLLAWFEPRGAKADKAKQVLAYVVGFSSDGTAKDVTVRYLKNHMWPGRTKGMRFPIEKVPVYNRHGKIKRYEASDWFKTVMSGYVRRDNKRTAVDENEEATDLKPVKPERKEAKEGEETLQSYKSSAEFVLERHLRREEAIPPGTKHVKIFTVKGKGKGDEASSDEKVYLRRDVVKCKSVETWHKEGRAPIVGSQPLKRVPYRAATTNRKRELAEAEAASGGEKMLQGLYSWDQTDWIIPPPVANGIIPKNSYGNMDVYVPSMVPVGAVHIPRRGTMKICKKLGIDFAEAVTGFEFGARMAIPIITGVVIAEENEEMVMEQWRKDEAERLRKEDEKRTKAALGMWRKFLMGLRIVERVREEYGDEIDEDVDILNPWTNKNKKIASIDDENQRRIFDQQAEDMAGGFLPEGHDEEPSQPFFPTRHEDDDDDGGGFIVEGNYQVGNSNKPTSRPHLTPISIQSNQISQLEEPKEHEDEVEFDEPPLKKVKTTPTRAGRKVAAKPKSNVASRTEGIPSAGLDSDKQTSKPRGRPKRKVPLADVEEEVGDSDSLSSFSDSGPETRPDLEEELPMTKPTKRRQVSTPKTETPIGRTRPKRQAAKKTESALRSHYFDDDSGGEL